MRNQVKRLRINYKYFGYVEVDYDESLVDFLSTVPRGSADNADIRIMKNYYNVFWPAEPVAGVNIPDTYLGYNVVSYNGKR